MKNAGLSEQTPPSERGSGSLEALLEHGDWLRQLARSLVASNADAQDLVQDTWVAAAGSPPPEGVPPRSWLGGIARNLVRNRIRKNARRRAHEAARTSETSARSAADEVHELEQQRRLLVALQRIPEAQRRAVVGRYYDGHSPRTLAARTGVPVATIKSHLQRGLRSLRAELDAEFGDRRSWGIALMPLALQANGKAAGMGSAVALPGPLLACAVIACAVAITAGWRLTRSAPTETQRWSKATDSALAVRSEGARHVAPDASGLPTIAEPSAAPASRTDPGSSEGRLVLRARDRRSGLAVTEFDGWVADAATTRAALARAGIEFDALQQLRPFAQPFESDESGSAVPASSPTGQLIAFATSGTRAGFGFGVVPPDRVTELTIELVDAPPLEVRLVDAAGRQVHEDALVHFEALLPHSGTGAMGPDGRLETPADYDWESQGVIVDDGVGEVRLVLSSRNRSQPFEAAAAVQTRRFRVSAPGVMEFARSTIACLEGALEPVRGGGRVIDVERPALGSLQLELRDASGARLSCDGRATLRFVGVPTGMDEKAYEATLTDGVAAWPQIVAGSRSVAIEIAVPSLGQTWTATGTGPAVDGDSALLTTSPPAANALSGLLVNADGEPIRERLAHLVHGAYHRLIEGRTDAEGRVRFVLPDGGLKQGPYLIEVFEDDPCVGHCALPLTELQARSGGDLGQRLVHFPPATSIRGTLETPTGLLDGSAIVALTRGGRVRRTAVVKNGRFEFEDHFGETETLTVHVLQPGETRFTLDRSREPDAAVTLRPHELTGAIEVQIAAAVAAATVSASIDASGVDIDPRDVRVWLQPEVGRSSVLLDWVSRRAEYRAENVPPGVYTAFVTVRGTVPCAAWDDVVVRAGDDLRDPRLHGIRLTSLIRAIDVRWTSPEDPATGAPRPPLMLRFEPAEVDTRLASNAAVFASSPPFALVVPRGLAGTIHVSAFGFRTATWSASDVGEKLDVDLEPGIELSLRMTGTPLAGARFRLRLEEGERHRRSPADLHAPEVPLPEHLEQGDVWSHRFPEPGRYRLMRWIDGGRAGWSPLDTTVRVGDDSSVGVQVDVDLAGEALVTEEAANIAPGIDR
ncbi:MAG: RNA polymerase sigma factor [Planctomycetota bacterium]